MTSMLDTETCEEIAINICSIRDFDRNRLKRTIDCIVPNIAAMRTYTDVPKTNSDVNETQKNPILCCNERFWVIDGTQSKVELLKNNNLILHLDPNHITSGRYVLESVVDVVQFIINNQKILKITFDVFNELNGNKGPVVCLVDATLQQSCAFALKYIPYSLYNDHLKKNILDNFIFDFVFKIAYPRNSFFEFLKSRAY
jgi:hypothetical protein